MKNLKIIVFLSFFLAGAYQPVHGQFLKRLQKSVEKSAERTVIRKAKKKTAEEVDKGIDEALEKDEKDQTEKKESNKKQKEESSKAALLAVYDFDYRYEMKITTGEGGMNVNYFLKPDASYLGMKMEQQGVDMFMVMVTDAQVVHSFIKMGDRKIASSVSMDNDLLYDQASKQDLKEYTITALPNKKFLGYTCTGVQMENEDTKSIFYYTDKAGVSFNNIFKTSQTQTIPPELKKYFDDSDKNLIMYMEMTDKKEKKNNVTKMECISFGPTDLAFDTSGYTSF